MLRFWLLGQVLDGDALTGIDSVIFLLKKSILEIRFAQVDIAHEAVVDHDALGAVLALALCFIDVDVVDQLLEQRCGEGANLHESADRLQEAVPALLHGAKLGEPLTVVRNLVLELHPFYLVLVRQLHEPLVRHLAAGVVLIELFICGRIREVQAMNRDDYLEEEWPEESPAEPETPAEEEKSDRGLYTYDTTPSEEEEDKNAKASPEETDFQNAEHFTFRLIDDHRIYKMEDPPKIESKTKWYEKAETCFQIYFDNHDLYYFHGFLHYIEPTLNRIASGFMLRYAMAGHFADLKQEAVLGLLEAEQHYDPKKGKRFLQYSKAYMKNRMHYYIRKMRRGCTVTTAYADRKLRTVMKTFYDHGGRNDLETICTVAEEMKIPQEEATEIIQRALLNALCAGTDRQFGTADGEWEEIIEERTISPHPEPYEALVNKCQSKALCNAWENLDYREQEIFAAHLGFCPECFNTLARIGESGAWYDCATRKRTPYADLAIDFGLSSAESSQRICEQAIIKLHSLYENIYASLLCLQDCK